jgi:Trypsin
MPRTTLVLALSSMLFAVGCGVEGEFAHSSDLELSTQAIVNGMPSPELDDSAMALLSGTGSLRAGCTATLIAPDIVLTALHCVAESGSGPFTCRPDGTLSSPPPNGVLGATVEPSSIEVRMGAKYKTDIDALGAKVFRSGATDICKQDIAVVVLDRELDAPISRMRLHKRTQRGEYIRAVGYGASGMGSTDRFARDGLRVTDVGEDQTAEVAGNAPPYTFVTGEGPCQGDSGGPAFSEETGALMGVYSISASVDCETLGVRNIYTALAPFEPLLMKAFEYAGREPLLEAGDADAGAPPSKTEDDTQDDAVKGQGSGSRQDPGCLCSAVGRTREDSDTGLPMPALAALATALLAQVRRSATVRVSRSV